MIAALYVDPKGPYFGREDVDPWELFDAPLFGLRRDARLYAGPWPVVAHPPCNRWGRFWWRGELGADGGCFEAALKSVKTWGGVLEHPEGTLAWERFGLEAPERGGWRRSADGGWVCSVDQSNYGHRSRKRTWLYYVGEREPFALDWSDGPSHVLVAANARSRRLGLPVMLQRRGATAYPPPVRGGRRVTDEKRVLSDEERRELARRDRAALLVYQALREGEKAEIDRVCRESAHRFTETDHGPRREATGGTWDCYLSRKKDQAFRYHMDAQPNRTQPGGKYRLQISDAVADPLGAEDAAIAASGGMTFAERLAARLEGRKAPQARNVVQQARIVRDGQLAAAWQDRWEEGRE